MRFYIVSILVSLLSSHYCHYYLRSSSTFISPEFSFFHRYKIWTERRSRCSTYHWRFQDIYIPSDT